MNKLLKIFIAFIVSWLFFFPITFSAFPTINSKMVMAILGLLIVAYDIAKGKLKNTISKQLIVLLIIAGIFSILCFTSVAYNNTDDIYYSTYIVSMIVWLSAAYMAFRTIRYAHERVSIELISYYIIALCAIQCIMALIIDLTPALDSFLRHYTIMPKSISWESRLIGIGTAQDTAGTRFCAALVICAVMIVKKSRDILTVLLLSTSFFIIVIIGNMMSRTTTVGAIIAVSFLLYKSQLWKFKLTEGTINILKITCPILMVVIVVTAYLYKSSPEFNNLIGFGFEGFVNYMETGKWETHSSNILQGMWNVWPDNIKTWLIGDGYFINPDNPHLYYKGTDVGYGRFIFYCGILGMAVFASFFAYLTYVCNKRFPSYSSLFYLLLILVFVIWIKVATDIFLIFAFYLSVPPENKLELSE